MSTINDEARTIAWKILLITTIVLTILWNLALLYKIISATGSAFLGGPRAPRFQTLVSLLVGDIFVAVFSLVIETRLKFEDSKDVNCRSQVLAEVYLRYIMPLTYGAGLVILTIECAIFRSKIQRALPLETPGWAVSLAVSTIPWILAITIALPLTIADVDLETCPLSLSLNFTRSRAIIYVCQVCPVVIAGLSTALNIYYRPSKSSVSVGNEQAPAVAFTSFQGQPNITDTTLAAKVDPTAPPYEGKQNDYAEAHPGVSILPSTVASGPLTFYPNQQNLVQNFSLTQQGGFTAFGFTQNQHQHQIIPNVNKQPMSSSNYQKHYSEFGQYPNQVQFPSPVPTTQHGQYQAQFLPLGTTTYTPSGQPSRLPPPPSLRPFYSVREKSALAMSALVLFVCVIPMAIFQLSYVLNEDRQTLYTRSRVAITDLVFWLMAVRSFVSPFFWVVSGSFKFSDSK